MKEQILFLNMFAQYDPKESVRDLLSRAEIVSAGIDQATRVINVAIYSPSYISAKVLETVASDICACYRLTALNISAHFPAEQLSQIDPEDLMAMFVEVNSMARSVLAGAKWSWDAW